MNFYNHVELYNPLILAFFPEFDKGKIFRMSIITDLETYDVSCLTQAQDLNEGFKEALEAYDDVDIVVDHNERYFPKPKGVEIEEDNSMLMGDSLFFRSEPEYNQYDFIVSHNFVFIGDEVVASIATMTINEPVPKTKQYTLH